MKTGAFLLVFLVLAGCTAYQSEPLFPGYVELDFYSSTGAHRGMYDNNTYISTYDPSVKISVNPRFSYTPNRAHGKLRHQFHDGDTSIYIHYYPIAQMSSSGVIEPMEKRLWQKISQKQLVDEGFETMAGYNWAYRIWVTPTENGCLLTKDTAAASLDQDVLLLRYVEFRKDMACEPVTNKAVATHLHDWTLSLKENFNRDLAMEFLDLRTLDLGYRRYKGPATRRYQDDSLVEEMDPVSSQ